MAYEIKVTGLKDTLSYEGTHDIGAKWRDYKEKKMPQMERTYY